jgi:hypothetical protein
MGVLEHTDFSCVLSVLGVALEFLLIPEIMYIVFCILQIFRATSSRKHFVHSPEILESLLF